MCSVCGCGNGSASIDGQAAGPVHHHDHGHDHHHPHGHGQHHHGHGAAHHHHDHHHEEAAGHGVGSEAERIIRIERDILGKNDRLAGENRARFARDGVLVFNLVSSPGAGKTSLLVRLVSDLKARHAVAVIEGDQQTANDAERIRAAGVPAIQINTGKGCHLDAAMVGDAYSRLPALAGGILFIENVGNLVCPAAFDLGEACKIVVFSTPEGEDKPLKYPDMFAASQLMLVNKIDLAAALDFDLAATIEHARRVNPAIEALTVSARSGEGLSRLVAWIERRLPMRQAHAAAVAEAQ